MIKKISTYILTMVTILIFGIVPAFAHSIVIPNQVGIAATQTFTLIVPTEKTGSTVAVKLLLPPGLNFVTPVIQAGWKAEVKQGPIPSGITPPKAADGDLATTIPTEVDWTGGSIPSGQKAQFEFSAQVPAQVGELDWKVYQTYNDGSIVSWDLGPKDPQPKDNSGNSTFDSKGPYSKTMVVNDLTGANANSGMMNNQPTVSNTTNQAMVPSSEGSKGIWLLAGLALLLSVVSLGLQFRKGKTV